MQRLIIFLLIGPLIVLLPFSSSMNIFSNAIALNIVPSMNNDDQDYLQRYERFYKDESFREDYYNYHKQHHQQEQQQQSSHNNYYNYETDHHNNNKKYYATDPKNNIGIPYPYNENNNYDEVKYSSNYESEYSHHKNENNNYKREIVIK